MFNFFFGKKEVKNQDFSKIAVDMHSHLIPAIDDGAKTIEDSLTLIKGLKELGFSKIITTPHIYYEYYPNTKDTIGEGLAQVKAALAEQNIAIPIEASAEYFMDDYFEASINNNNVVPLHHKYLLVEMSFFGAPPKLEDYIFRIQLKGYTPILAHPERYLFYHNDFEAYREIKSKGVLLQMNAGSFLGYYGKPINQVAQRLIKENLIDLIGTDMHHAGHLEFLKTHLKNKEFQHILSSYEFKNAELFG